MQVVLKSSRSPRGWRMAWALGLAAAAALALNVAPAWSATGYANVGSFGAPGINSGELTTPTKVAVDDATGHVLVVDSGNSRVQVFTPDSSAAQAIAEFSTGPGSSPLGIAIDQGTHAVYVSNADGGRIARYVSDGAPTPTYTLDGGYAGPAAGSGAGQIGSFSSPLAIDPRNGDLLVADRGNRLVSRFASDGTFLGSFDGSGSAGGPFTDPIDLAVDAAGQAYVVDFTSGSPFSWASVLDRFGPDGSARPAPAPAVDTPRSVAFDPHSGNVVVAGHSTMGALPHLFVLHDEVPVTDFDYPAATQGSAAAGLAVDGGASGRLYALTDATFGGIVGVQVFDPIVLPDLTLGAPTTITPTSAHLSGTVDPLGQSTDYRFEYSTNGSDWSPGPGGNGTTARAFEADLAGLAPNTSYRVRLFAATAQGSIATGPRTFATALSEPGTATGPATDVGTDRATLRGQTNPFGLQTTYHFEYGPTAGYGSRTPVASELPAGNGRTPRQVARGITGLAAGATYHYRLVAQSAGGTATGGDRTFTTANDASRRAYELVSPADKGGANVDVVRGFQATSDGGALWYHTKSAMSGDRSAAAPLTPAYLARRAGAGWSTVALDPPQLTSPALTYAFTRATLALSRDGSHALVVSLAKLADGAVAGDSNAYLLTTATGTLQTVATSAGTTFYDVARSPLSQFNVFLGGNADFSRLYLAGGASSLLAGTPAGSIYDWHDGRLRLASVQPDGTPIAGATAGDTGTREQRYVSDDGSRVFFSDTDQHLWVRVDGTTTISVSASHQATTLGVPQVAHFQGATADGGQVFLTAQDLTDDSAPGQYYLYRFDVDSGRLTLLAQSQRAYQVSPRGDYVYFNSDDPLTPDAGAGPHAFLWQDGRIALVGSAPTRWMASPNGRFFAFTSYDRLTDFDNASSACQDIAQGDPGNACAEVYRYDADRHELTCASCRTDGGTTKGNANIGPDVSDFGFHFPNAMLDDGRVVFDTPDPLAAGDANSSRDVYAFDGRQATLISAGTGPGASQLADVTPDGRNVFFTTEDRLVGQDADTLTDVYDARVGGGLAAQNPEPPRGGCAGDDCREAAGGPVSSAPVSSQGAFAVPRPAAKGRRATVKVVDATFQGTVLRLRVSVSGSGRIRVSGPALHATKRAVARTGLYVLHVPLAKKQGTARRAGRSVKARISVVFTPAFGPHVSSKLTRTASRQAV